MNIKGRALICSLLCLFITNAQADLLKILKPKKELYAWEEQGYTGTGSQNIILTSPMVVGKTYYVESGFESKSSSYQFYIASTPNFRVIKYTGPGQTFKNYAAATVNGSDNSSAIIATFTIASASQINGYWDDQGGGRYRRARITRVVEL